MAKQRSVDDLEKQLKALQATMESQVAPTKAQLSAQERITKELERQKSLREEELNTTKEIDDTLQSIASTHGKNNDLYKNTQKRLGVIQGSLTGIVSWSNKWNGANRENKENILNAAKGYRNVNAQVLKNIALIADGKEAQENINDLIDEQKLKHEAVLKSIVSNTKQSQALKKEIQGEIDAMDKLAKAAKKAEANVTAITREGEKFAGTMVGGALDKTMKAFGSKKGVGGLIEKINTSAGTVQKGGGMGGMLGNVMGGVAKFLGPIGLAVGGIMAAAEFFNSGGAAKMAMSLAMLTGQDPNKAAESAFKQSQQYRDIMVEQNYGLPLKLQQQASDDYLGYKQSVEEDSAKYKESLITDEFEYRMSLESDAIQFRQQQASAELDANLSRQKTLFTSGMGYMKQAIGVSERALIAIGSSTAALLDTVKEYGYTLGIALKDQIKLSAAAQGLAVRYGSSATDVFKMADTFRLMNKTSAKTGANLVAGLEDLAKKNDMSPAQLYKEMADAQADILKYSSYTTEEYARQAIQLGNMNTSMANMLKASDSMVLNYKDSIKAEMSLSAMLGKNVNFSEVRAKLMSGDQAGGAAALKTALGGQDINAMNAFQKQALSQATGMGIQELMQLTQSKGGDAKGTLEERNALKTGKAIAQGALTQDIANAAAKLALDQKNRAEMLKFEQAKRIGMLFIEQKMRLNAIEREFKYREEREEYGIEKAKQNAMNTMEKEVRGSQLMSITNAYSDSLGSGKFDQKKVDAFKTKTMASQDVLQQASAGGFIDNSQVADIGYKIAMAAAKGQVFDVSQITGVQSYLEQNKKDTDVYNAGQIQMLDMFEKYTNSIGGKDEVANRNYLQTHYKEMFKTMQIKGAKMGSETGELDKEKLKSWNAEVRKSFKKASYAGTTGPDTTLGKNGKKGSTVVTTNPLTGKKEIKPIADTTITSKNTPQLSDSQAQTKLQVQMVKIMGISAQFLGAINENTAKDGTKIGGKLISQALLNQASRNFAIAGVPLY